MFGKTNVASVSVQREAVPHGVSSIAKPQSTKATGIGLESIFTLPPDDKLQEQLALFQAHYDRASSEDRENMPPPMTLSDTSRQTEYISLSRDGTAIATRRHYDNRIVVVDANTRLAVSSFTPDATTDPTGRFQLTPTGKELATEAKNRRSVVFLDTKSGHPIRQTPEVPANILQFAFSPDGSVLAIGYDRGLLVWNLRDGSAVVDKKLAGTGKNCFLVWSRDSTLFAIVFNNEATVWSTSNWTQVYSWQGPVKANYRYPVMAVDFTSDGVLIAGDNLGYLSRIDIRAQSIKRLTEVETTPVWAISAAPTGPIVAVGRGDGSLELWDVAEGRELARASGHGDSPAVQKFVQCIQWFPDGRQLCTWGGYDARIWSISFTAQSEGAARQS
jgi:WD40 repeat protein